MSLHELKKQKKLRRKGIKISGGSPDVCYISLKPFSKKERKMDKDKQI
jgi:NifB/MoaA-like Fe-S oxidoreductase